MTAFRKGDRVSIDAVVTSDPFKSDGLKIKVSIEPYHDIFVPASIATMKEPVFGVGDRVCLPRGSQGEIIGISDKMLWVKIDSGAFTSITAGECARVDPDDPDFAEIDLEEVPAVTIGSPPSSKEAA